MSDYVTPRVQRISARERARNWRYAIVGATAIVLGLIGARLVSTTTIENNRSDERVAILEICSAYAYGGGTDQACPEKVKEMLREMGWEDEG